MKKIYFIDSENVGDSWIDLLKEGNSRFLVFYTGRSPRIAYPHAIQIMNASNKPEFIECFEGNNGLDFQLVSYLGYELHANKGNEMIIVSNDTGFDPVVHFWTNHGIKIKRMPLSNSSNANGSGAKEAIDNKDVIIFSSCDDKINGVDRNELNTIIRCIGKKAPSDIHLTLVHLYGSKNGENIYKCLKKEKFKSSPVKWTKEKKMKMLIELIIKHTNKYNVMIPGFLSEYIINNVVEDKKEMSKKLNSFCKESSSKLHKMFSPFYKILVKIKNK